MTPKCRNKRAKRTPLRFKNGAGEGSPSKSPRVTQDSAEGDRVSVSNTVKTMSNKNSLDYMAGLLDKVITTMTVLSSVLGGSGNNLVSNILSADAEGKISEEEVLGAEGGEGVGGEAAEAESSDDGKLDNGLLINGNRKVRSVMDELNAVNNSVNDLRKIVENFIGKKISGDQNNCDNGADSQELKVDKLTEQLNKQYELKVDQLNKQITKEKEDIKRMLEKSKNDIQNTLSANQNSQNMPRQQQQAQQQQQQQQQHQQ